MPGIGAREASATIAGIKSKSHQAHLIKKAKGSGKHRKRSEREDLPGMM